VTARLLALAILVTLLASPASAQHPASAPNCSNYDTDAKRADRIAKIAIDLASQMARVETVPGDALQHDLVDEVQGYAAATTASLVSAVAASHASWQIHYLVDALESLGNLIHATNAYFSSDVRRRPAPFLSEGERSKILFEVRSATLLVRRIIKCAATSLYESDIKSRLATGR
jgi:hypothetical protein